jgi:hypothetical protein
VGTNGSYARIANEVDLLYELDGNPHPLVVLLSFIELYITVD